MSVTLYISSSSSNKRPCTSQDKLKCSAKYNDINWRVLSIAVTYLNFQEILKFYRTCKQFKDIRFIAIAINAPSCSLKTAQKNVNLFKEHVWEMAQHFEGTEPSQAAHNIVKYGSMPDTNVALTLCSSYFHLWVSEKISAEAFSSVAKFMLRVIPQQTKTSDEGLLSRIHRMMLCALTTPVLVPVRKLLLLCGIDLNKPVKVKGIIPKKISLLTHAVVTGHDEAVRYLCQNGVDVNGDGNRNNKTPMHYCAEKGSMQICQILLQFKADISISEDTNGNTPIHTAIQAKSHDIVSQLLQHDPSCREDVNDAGHTPLLYALEIADPSSARLLIEANADPNLSNSTTTPLILACNSNNLNFVQLLLAAKADVNQATDFGRTPLMAAVQSTDEILETMLKEFPKLDAKDTFGNRALHFVIKFCLMRATEKAKQGRTINEILFTDSFDNMLTLLRFKPNSSVTNNMGESPFQYAVSSVPNSPARSVAVQALLKAIKVFNNISHVSSKYS